jgi:hypothetical protein
MRVELMRDMCTLGIRAENQARNTRTVTEQLSVKLRKRVRRALGMRAVPLFDDRWLFHMVEPTTPVIPSDKNGDLPQSPPLTIASTGSSVQLIPSVTF